MRKKGLVFLILAAMLPLGAVTVVQKNGKITITADKYRAFITPADGHLRRMDFGGKKTVFYPSALWRAMLKSGNIDCNQSKCTGVRIDGNRLEMDYDHARMKVTIFIHAKEDMLEIHGKAQPKKGEELLEFGAPACVQFPALEEGEGVICQFRGSSTPGFRLKGEFFRKRPIWHRQNFNDSGFLRFFGTLPEQRTVPYVVDLKPAESFNKFLTQQTYREAICFKDHTAICARPEWPLPEKNAGLVLLRNSKSNEPVLTAHRLGGENGALFRMGSLILGTDRVQQLIRLYGVIAREHCTSERNRIYLIDVPGILPEWTSSINNWVHHLAIVNVKPILIRDGEMLADALKDPHAAAIINPHANACMPLMKDGKVLPFEELLDRVEKFVKNGGFWMECQGKKSFTQSFVSKQSNLTSNWVTVPNSFADFAVFEYNGGRELAVYSVQPCDWEPFAGAKDISKMYIVPRFLFLGKPNGNGVLERRFVLHAKDEKTVTTPVTRLHVVPDVYAAAKAFQQANGITKTMDEMYEPEFLRKFKSLLMVADADVHRTKYSQNKVQIEKLPPNIYHLTFYMLGDFDKKYPDLLPPLPRWGTLADFDALSRQIKAKGGLFMPYTNPTMWCDAPKGPTFEREGEAPLQYDLNGRKVRESWGATTSWATCLWHPAVRAINDEIVRSFSKDHAVDIVFQDQIGARSLPRGAAGYDTNAASPAPHARIEGFLSQAKNDFKKVPLGTEDFWAHLARTHLIGQGLNESTVRLNPGKSMMKDIYPPETFEIFPLTALLTHEQSSMFYIRTGLAIPDMQIAWALALGYGMYAEYSYLQSSGADLDRIWYLAEIHKAVAARYTGKPLKAFKHNWGKNGNDGTITAQYGNVKIFSNFLPEPQKYGTAVVAANGGFWAESGDGVKAGRVRELGGLAGDNAFIVTPEEIKVYGKGGDKAVFPCGRKLSEVRCEGKKLTFIQKNNSVQVILPVSAKKHAFLHELKVK